MLRWLRMRFGRPAPTLRELSEPFAADVILDDVVVATLSDRRPSDMFWRSYRVEPVAGNTAIYDDELWKQVRFTFRDPKTGQVCTIGFAGGALPIVRDGRVRLRGMYFGEPTPLPRAALRAPKRS